MTEKLCLVLGSVLAGLGVAAGAFGAHGLKPRLSADMLAVFETGVRYHLIHAIALLIVGLLWVRFQSTALTVGAWSFLAGIVIFSGSLYALSLSGVKWLGAITPIGGVALLVGWVALAVAALNR